MCFAQLTAMRWLGEDLVAVGGSDGSVKLYSISRATLHAPIGFHQKEVKYRHNKHH
jgi:hypothetical protein